MKHHLVSCTTLLLALACVATLTPADADERAVAAEPATTPATTQATTQAADPSKASATTPSAPAAAYIIDENEKSQMAKRSVPGGWREVKVREVVYWCQQTKQFGSRTRAEERCLTPDQYDQLQRDSAKLVDQIRAKERAQGGGG